MSNKNSKNPFDVAIHGVTMWSPPVKVEIRVYWAPKICLV